ncbi:putative SGNH hydrolase-type esterase domain-containing protein [Medicago truncatula]|uniref:GDSL-like lipase/acylhydrolase n=1 Tax=Medicago truncatula TaxID=3880 RepID=A0A072U1V3_MEDTR|nr:GDSL esterase/lipase CPRD49 isoform X2 [Medicago truncatula]KEH23163.1 GDSL-like lipase/acylhydrolase [Medicago truncatula]RHN46457.1 putative SGNH hydrolase-type esterase domain-containing protein [Medicago truncatula]
MRPKFVLFGSSIVQYSYYEGWGATLSHLYARKADILLRGYAGWNSRHALQVLDKIFSKNAIEQPSLVIAYFGGNDCIPPHPSGLGPHVPLGEYIENMKKIATHIMKTRIILLSNPPINEAQMKHNIDDFGQPIRTNEVSRIYSEACLDMCCEMKIKAIDTWSAIQKRDDWRDFCFIDGVHLSNEGSEIVTKEILNVIKEAEWEPSLYWKLMPAEFGEDSPYDMVTLDGKTINFSNVPFPEDVDWP